MVSTRQRIVSVIAALKLWHHLIPLSKSCFNVTPGLFRPFFQRHCSEQDLKSLFDASDKGNNERANVTEAAPRDALRCRSNDEETLDLGWSIRRIECSSLDSSLLILPNGMSTHLLPPRQDYINPEYTVPLTPHTRPPFSHYQSSSTLPNTPHTPFPQPSGPARSAMASTRLKPYLGLPARLLLTTFSPALLPLILTIAHLIHNRSSTASLAASLRASLLSACSGIATGAAGLLTMPRYLAMQTNEQAVRATQASILAIGSALGDCVTIIEVVVIFIVETYRSMLLCTIELVVRGTLEVLIGAVQTVSLLIRLLDEKLILRFQMASPTRSTRYGRAFRRISQARTELSKVLSTGST